MADTHVLLTRISAFRQRLESLQPLRTEEPPRPTAQINDGPAHLTARAHRLLVDARELVLQQKNIHLDPAADDRDPLAGFHRGTVGLTDSALRLVQHFPAGIDGQLTACDGLEHLLQVVRQRLGTLDQALALRRTDTEMVDTLAGLLTNLHIGRTLPLNPIVALAETILDDARRAAPLRFLAPLEVADGSVAKFIAAHAINTAQVLARLVPHDYEWAAKPLFPVVAALVMDVGLLRVPAEVLLNAAPLSDADRRMIEAHPREGAEIVRRHLPDGGPLAEVVLTHHEHLDGTGYPNGFRGDSVPSLARFLAVADRYAAAVVDRPQRTAVEPRVALTDALMLGEDGVLDRDFTEYLLHLAFHPVGTVVELTDGRLAVVAANHGPRATVRAAGRPVVNVLTDADGRPLPKPECLDLAAADRGGIARAVPRKEVRAKLADWHPELCI